MDNLGKVVEVDDEGVLWAAAVSELMNMGAQLSLSMQAKSQEKGMAAGGGLISSLSIELKATKPSLSSLSNPKPQQNPPSTVFLFSLSSLRFEFL